MEESEKQVSVERVPLNAGLGRGAFEIADSVIEQAYPNIYCKEKGWWGEQRIPNWGILRGAIASAILDERKRSNVKVRGGTLL